MPAPGTLAALKDAFSAVRTVAATANPTTVNLEPADIGRLILVDTALGVVNLNLPLIGGDAAAGANGIGASGSIAILLVEASNALNVGSPGASPDTFNGGQAFSPIALTGQNDWLLCVSPGGSGVQDWAIFASKPGAL